MNQRRHVSRRLFVCGLAMVLCVGTTVVAQAQPRLSYDDLDKLVGRIALYPDTMVAQIFMAASYYDQIPDAAKWSDQHHYLTGGALAKAMTDDHLSWDPSVQALLPFPQVLEMMASDMAWTSQLGTAVLAQRGELMDSVQRMRHKAEQFGYLKGTPQIAVMRNGIYITIRVIRPDLYFLPVYDPAIVFAASAPGFAVATAVNFGFGIDLGVVFRPWWGRFDVAWDGHVWYMGDRVWNRTWTNRLTYVHPYSVQRNAAARKVETHELIARSAKEKEAEKLGHERVEEHQNK